MKVSTTITMLLISSLLLFTACKTPKIENNKVSNKIESITISRDSSMVNPMNPKSSSSSTVFKVGSILMSKGGNKIKVTKAQFDDVVEIIREVDLSSIKEIKHPPMVGSSSKSVEIKSNKEVYYFREDNYYDYPELIEQLIARVYNLEKNDDGFFENDTQWHKLKSLKEYAATEYNLGNNVKYLDIRTYIQPMASQNYDVDRYVVSAKLGKTPLQSFNAKLIKQFKDSPPNISKETNIRKKSFCLMRGCILYIDNAFMIDKDEKIWSLNEVKDIVKVLGEIDRPAEVKLLLWLNNNLRANDDDKTHKDKYKKTSTGYRVISEYENTMSNLGECGIFTYEIDINKQGKITKELTKKRETPNGCLAVD